MRSARRIILAAARPVAVTGVTVLPVIVFSRMLQAEGPLVLLYVWTAVCALLVHGAARYAPETRGLRRLHLACIIAAAVFSLAAILAVLAQVNVARRSLAEAWLELARQGRAFGFFSFFASEIYALFCLAQALLLGSRRYLPFALCAAATNFLCAGIILNRPMLLLISLAGTFLFFLVSRPKQSEEPLSTRFKSVMFPAASALVLAVLFALFSGAEGQPRQLIKTPDLSAFFARIAPSFPLMRDVPGYGFSAGGGEMPDSVYLSQRTLFDVQGTPFSVHYLADTRYRNWNGAVWTEDPDAGETLPVIVSDGPYPAGLALTLADDFYSGIPTGQTATSAILSPDAPAKATFTRNRGIRFEPSARRGMTAYLVSDGTDDAAARPDDPQFFTDLSSYAATASAPSPRIASLSRELRERADNSDREYIRLLLEHFSHGYRYSLQTASRKKNADTIEYFLFEGKQGFCLYFASAFVLLAREGGLPARLAEGFRVELDERGQGTISGNNAHAWPEVWIDGEWRLFEPTPPYAADDPFAWLGKDDQAARRQLEALFGESAGDANKLPNPKSVLTAALRLLAALAVATAMLYLAKRRKGKLRRQASRMVSRYRKRGISGPEVIGWLAWAREAERLEAGGKRTGKAAAVARAMIGLAYGEHV